MNAISELVSEYNNADIFTANSQEVKITALLVASMVNIFGLNKAASPESPETGWAGMVSQSLPSHISAPCRRCEIRYVRPLEQKMGYVPIS